jgi:membrane protein implicated in regulation of membrane protease activity
MTLLGIGLTGAAAAAFTVAFTGFVFGVVVAAATIAAVIHRRRRPRERVHHHRSGARTGSVGTGPAVPPTPPIGPEAGTGLPRRRRLTPLAA